MLVDEEQFLACSRQEKKDRLSEMAENSNG